MTKAELVSFRPGKMAYELKKRADKDDMSLTAKNFLDRILVMVREECVSLQRLFAPAEMQLLVAAFYDSDCRPGQLAEVIGDAFLSNSMVLAIARYSHIDGGALVQKVAALSQFAQFTIEDAVMQFRRLPLGEVFDGEGMPSLVVLRRLGLVEAEGPADWGLCVVNLADSPGLKFLLRKNPSSLRMTLPSRSTEELAMAMVTHTRASLEGDVGQSKDVFAIAIAYQIAIRTSFRHFCIIENVDGESAAITEIPRGDLVHDLHCGELPGIVLEGVNAPDPEPASADFQSLKPEVKKGRRSTSTRARTK